VRAGLRVQLLNGLEAPRASRPRYRHRLPSYAKAPASKPLGLRFMLRGRARPMDNY